MNEEEKYFSCWLDAVCEQQNVYCPKAERIVTFCQFFDFSFDRKIRIPDKLTFMFHFPLLCFLLGTCLSFTLANALAEASRNLPAEMGAAGAALWLKADEKRAFHTGVGNGTVVSTWKSKVGNLTATQSSNQSARIEGNQTIGNNKEAVFFPQGSGEAGYGYFEIPSNFNLKNSTVLVSLKYEGSTYAPRVLSFLANGTGADGSSNNALALMHFVETNKFRLESNGNNPSSPNYTSGNWSVLSYRIDGNGNMTVALDGVAGNQTSNLNMASQNSAGKIRIGMSGPGRQSSSENLVNAHIYEILIFNKYLNNDQYDEIQNYMKDSMGASSVQIVSLPTASPINRGETLSQSSLSGGNASSNGTTIIGNFTWSDNSTVVTQSGNFSAVFVPASAKYNFLGEVMIPVTVNPELNLSTNSLTGFRTRNGTASPSKSVSINGTNLTSNVTASVLAESGFEVSTNNSTFGSSVSLPMTSGTLSAPLYVRLATSATIGNKTATLSISSTSSNKSITLSGEVVDASLPYISVTPEALTNFETKAGTPSTSANFTVDAFNLSGNLTANATTGFEISLGNGTFSQTLEIPLTGGNVTNAPLNLRVAASASEGTLPGSVTLTSGNASATLLANGTVGQAPRTLPAPPAAAESSTPENSNTGKKIKKQKVKKKPKKKKNSVFTFPQVVATSGSTWITADGRVVSENQRLQSNTSK